MAYEGGEYSIENLFNEIKETSQREGITNSVQYKDLVDDLVEEKRIYGFFSDDEDITQVKKDLIARWAEIEPGLKKEATSSH